MEIIAAKTAGFCFGVSRAVQRAMNADKPSNLCALGSLTHNAFVLERIKERGIETIADISQARGRCVLIRTHGEGVSVYDELNQTNTPYIDCTCPYVAKIHRIAKEQTPRDTLIIAGDKTHPEVIGIRGHAAGDCIVLNSPAEAAGYDFDKNLSYSVVAQTTFVGEVYDEIISVLKAAGLKLNIFNTICEATRNRLSEAAEIAKRVDVMLVIGDKRSSNAVKLYEICKENCKKSYFFESIHDLVLKNISRCDRMGLTAGASTPPDIIESFKKALWFFE